MHQNFCEVWGCFIGPCIHQGLYIYKSNTARSMASALFGSLLYGFSTSCCSPLCYMGCLTHRKPGFPTT